MPTQLLAFHSELKIKTAYLQRVKDHAEADEIIKGVYWRGGKGCAVGCTIHSDKHNAYETELGIPEMLARLEDRIFEGSSEKYAKTWPERFLKAIKPGADLSKVGWKFQHWLLLDKNYGVELAYRMKRVVENSLNKQQRVYKCDSCQYWHLTSQLKDKYKEFHGAH